MVNRYPRIRECIYDELLTDGIDLRGNDGEFDEEKVRVFIEWIIEDALNPNVYLKKFGHYWYKAEDALNYIARAQSYVTN